MKARRTPPERECRGGCGRKRRTWASSWLCRFCVLEGRAASPESFRATRRRLSGRCVVCGGPWPDGSGCEHCPAVDPRTGGRTDLPDVTPERPPELELAPGIRAEVRADGYGHAAQLMLLDGGAS